MGFLTACFTGNGGREINEDSIYYKQTKDSYIAIVADGLGSHGGGDIASKTAVDTLSKCFLLNNAFDNDNILNCFDAANQAVLEKQTAACQMKSTAVVLLARKNQAAFAHVGDSRLYHFKDGKLKYQTEDHSVSQMAVNSGAITASQIRFHEDRNRLLRALGGNETVRPAVMIPEPLLTSGDAFLLCSDGFWEYVLETEMEVDLIKSETPKQWLSYLLERIGKRISEKNDNLSAIAVFYT